jgi:hypothetical protein
MEDVIIVAREFHLTFPDILRLFSSHVTLYKRTQAHGHTLTQMSLFFQCNM